MYADTEAGTLAGSSVERRTRSKAISFSSVDFRGFFSFFSIFYIPTAPEISRHIPRLDLKFKVAHYQNLRERRNSLSFQLQSFSMSFSAFHGNEGVVRQLREMLARERFPHAMILAGPEGAGKYTLALMLARTMNCLQPTETDGLPDYCGVCRKCERIGEGEDMEGRPREAPGTPEGGGGTDKRG